MMNKQVIKITPIAKPRMTQRDKWKKRPIVTRYFTYRTELKNMDLEIEWDKLSINFVLPMPKSWSKKKKLKMNGRPHKSTPDLDNLLKGFKDALLDQDCEVWYYHRIFKTWGNEGAIMLNPEFIPVNINN